MSISITTTARYFTAQADNAARIAVVFGGGNGGFSLEDEIEESYLPADFGDWATYQQYALPDGDLVKIMSPDGD